MLDNIKRRFYSLKQLKYDKPYCNLVKSGERVGYDGYTSSVGKIRAKKLVQIESSFQHGYPIGSDEVFEWFKPNMIYCPAGEFEMGANRKGCGEISQEIIEAPFLLGETEVTQFLYILVMGYNPSVHQKANTSVSKTKQLYQHFDLMHPVENVSWYDAVDFCNRLSDVQGLQKCYTFTNINRLDEGDGTQGRIVSADVSCDFSKSGYRLPTEKEWEYAAKTDEGSNYAGVWQWSNIDQVAWCKEDYDKGSTHPVKIKNPNSWGFYDMIGNVREWCWDKDGADDNEISRRVRGGDYSRNQPTEMIASYLVSEEADGRLATLGFRLCRSLIT